MATDIIRVLGQNVDGSGTTGQSLSRGGLPLAANGRAWDMLVDEQGRPLLDSEQNLLQTIYKQQLDEFQHQLALTGFTTRAAANYDSGTNRLIMGESFAIAKGRVLHMTDPSRGDATLAIALSAPPASGTRTDLIFLELWFHEVAPVGSTTSTDNYPGDRQSVYWYGGADNGVVTNDLKDPVLNIETSRRVQLRWRFREVTGFNFAMHGNGLYLTDAAIFARGGTTLAGGVAGAAYNYVNLAFPDSPDGPRVGNLYRAGLGDRPSADALNTVDGYCYAMAAFRLTRTPSTTGIGELRPLSRLYIPPHTIRWIELAYGTDLEPGVVGRFPGGAYGVGNILAESIKGGAGGDVGHKTIDRYNLADDVIGPDQIENNAIHIYHINDDVGLGTKLLTNATGVRCYNGTVVRINPANPTQFVFAAGAGDESEIGVVAHVVRGSAQDYIEPNAAGYVRVQGRVSILNVKDEGTGQVIIPGTPLQAAQTAGYARVGAVAHYLVALGALTIPGGGTATVEALVLGDVLRDGSITTAKLVDQIISEAKLASSAVSNRTLATDAVDQRVLAVASVGTPELIDANVTTAKLADGAVTSQKIADGGVATVDLADGSVTNVKIAAGAVDSAKIADGSIQTVDLNDGAVTLGKMAPNSVDSSKIVDGGVATVDLADGAVTNAKLADSAVNSSKIADGSIQTVDLNDGAVATAKLADGAVTSQKIADGGVQTVDLADGAVTSQKIADGTIQSADLADGAVTSAKIADGAVTSAKIADGSVQTVDLNDGAVTTAKLANNAVTTPRILDATVTPAKLAVVPAVRVVLGGSLVVNNTPLTIPWTAAERDEWANQGLGSMWSAGDPTKLVLPIPGIYKVSVSVLYPSPVSVGNYGDLVNGIRDVAIFFPWNSAILRFVRLQTSTITNVDVPTIFVETLVWITPSMVGAGHNTVAASTYQTSGAPYYIGDGGVTGGTVLEAIWQQNTSYA